MTNIGRACRQSGAARKWGSRRAWVASGRGREADPLRQRSDRGGLRLRRAIEPRDLLDHGDELVLFLGGQSLLDEIGEQLPGMLEAVGTSGNESRLRQSLGQLLVELEHGAEAVFNRRDLRRGRVAAAWDEQ